ncbi:MAG: cell division protein SepF [Clostridia bacterium]|nr:cell division protein SepF [Clostridia bacterium]
MGLFSFFRKKKYYYDDDEFEEEEKEEAPANVSLEGALELKICKPRTFEQALPAVDYLSSGRTVLLNLEGVDEKLYLRIIDFISGAAYALGLTIKKATNDSFFITPRDVDVSGELFETADDEEEFFTL